MKSHRTDLAALIFGLAFVVAGGAFLFDELSDDAFDPAWTFSIAFVLIGVIALATTLVRGGRDHEAIEPNAAPATGDTEAAS
jgi:hypothetical protein